MVDVGPHFGPIALGIISNLVLYGVLFTQCFIYRATYKKDRMWLKLYVAYLLIIETFNSGFLGAVLYQYLIVHFGDLEYLAKATWVFQTDPALTGLISMSVQYFFAWRVKILTGKTYLAVIICLLATVGFLGGLGTAVAAFWLDEFVQFQSFKPIVVIWLVGSAIPDIMVTATLVWWLRKNKTGFPATDDLIERTMRLVVQTGLITAVCATVDVIAFVSSGGPTHLFFGLSLPKLYTNALMSTLNSRAGWGAQDLDNSASSRTNGSVKWASMQKPTSIPSSRGFASNRAVGNVTDPYLDTIDGSHELGTISVTSTGKISPGDTGSLFEDKTAQVAPFGHYPQPVHFNVRAEP